MTALKDVVAVRLGINSRAVTAIGSNGFAWCMKA